MSNCLLYSLVLLSTGTKAHDIACPDPVLEVPDGPFIQQLCGKDRDCLRKRFDYDEALDELRIYESLYDLGNSLGQSYLKAPGACSLKRMGFDFVMTKRSSLFSDSHILDELAIQDLSGQHAIEHQLKDDDSRQRYRSVISWLEKEENDFKKSCRDVWYFPASDTLRAICLNKQVDYYRLNNTVLPHLSLYMDKGVRLRNINGYLQAERCVDSECFPYNNQEIISQHCRENGMAITAIGETLACSTANPSDKPDISGCKPIEFVMNTQADMILVRCEKTTDVLHLHNVSLCSQKDYEIAVSAEKSEQSTTLLKWLFIHWNPFSVLLKVGEYVFGFEPNILLTADRNLMCILPGQLSSHRNDL